MSEPHTDPPDKGGDDTAPAEGPTGDATAAPEGPAAGDTAADDTAADTEAAPPGTVEPSSPSLGQGWRPTPMWYMAEIIVVVVGVIIALAANAWWEGRRAAVLEAEVRRAVRVELEGNVQELRAALAETAECLERTDRLLRRTPASLAAVPADSTFFWVSGVSCRRTFDPAFGAARALTGAPGFDSVDDLAVRTAVAAWVTAIEDAAEERDQLSAYGSRVYDHLSRYAAAESDRGLAPFPTLPRLAARTGPSILRDLRADTALIRTMLHRAHYQRAYQQELTEALAAAERALGLLSDPH